MSKTFIFDTPEAIDRGRIESGKMPHFPLTYLCCFVSAGDYTPQMSFMDHLTNEEEEYDIFNGAPDLPDYTVLNLDLENGKRT